MEDENEGAKSLEERRDLDLLSDWTELGLR